MNILSIGNSFSQDAQRYLHRIAAADGATLNTFNLMIGGCSLETHWGHITDGLSDYYLEKNGKSCDRTITLPEALEMDEWDVITVQQASHYSGMPQTYVPYLTELVAFVKEKCPKAKIYFHQTWAYETCSVNQLNPAFSTDADMFAAVEPAYRKAAELISADGIIPSGKAMLTATQMGIEKIHSDTFHASRGAGR